MEGCFCRFDFSVFIHLYLSLSVYLSIYLSIYLFIHVPILPSYISLYLFIYLSIFIVIHVSTLSIYEFTFDPILNIVSKVSLEKFKIDPIQFYRINWSDLSGCVDRILLKTSRSPLIWQLLIKKSRRNVSRKEWYL